MENNYKVEIFKASVPDKNIIGWRVMGNTVEEVIGMYELIKSVGAGQAIPFKGNESGKFDPENPVCRKCKGPMWDNRTNKQKPTSPDFVCKQSNGECLNEKGFKTSIFLKSLK